MKVISSRSRVSAVKKIMEIPGGKATYSSPVKGHIPFLNVIGPVSRLEASTMDIAAAVNMGYRVVIHNDKKPVAKPVPKKTPKPKTKPVPKKEAEHKTLDLQSGMNLTAGVKKA